MQCSLLNKAEVYTQSTGDHADMTLLYAKGYLFPLWRTSEVSGETGICIRHVPDSVILRKVTMEDLVSLASRTISLNSNFSNPLGSL